MDRKSRPETELVLVEAKEMAEGWEENQGDFSASDAPQRSAVND